MAWISGTVFRPVRFQKGCLQPTMIRALCAQAVWGHVCVWMTGHRATRGVFPCAERCVQLGVWHRLHRKHRVTVAPRYRGVPCVYSPIAPSGSNFRLCPLKKSYMHVLHFSPLFHTVAHSLSPPAQTPMPFSYRSRRALGTALTMDALTFHRPLRSQSVPPTQWSPQSTHHRC